MHCVMFCIIHDNNVSKVFQDAMGVQQTHCQSGHDTDNVISRGLFAPKK